MKATNSIALKNLRQEFKLKIAHNKAYRHAVLRHLYASQTSDEQATKKTQYLNGAGFTAPDAPVLSNIAARLKAGGSLEPIEELVLRQRLPKYVMQFTVLRKLEELTASAVQSAHPEAA